MRHNMQRRRLTRGVWLPQGRYEVECRSGKPSAGSRFEYAMQLTHAADAADVNHGILLFQSACGPSAYAATLTLSADLIADGEENTRDALYFVALAYTRLEVTRAAA